MATSRLKIRTHSPLKPFQAWIPINPDQTIHSLKLAIIQLLQPSNPIFPLEPNHIVLELDAFAFLDQSLCSLIDPIHDLIDVKLVAPVISNHPAQRSGKKRSRSQSNLEPDPEPSRKLTTPRSSNQQPIRRPIPDAGKDQDLSKKISSPLPDQPIEPLPVPNSNQKTTVSQPARKAPAPPGQGKPSTKARNHRKRLQKIRNREQNHSQSMTTNPILENEKSTQPLNHHPKHNSTSVAECQASHSARAASSQIKQGSNRSNSGSSSQNNLENQSDSDAATSSSEDKPSSPESPSHSLAPTESSPLERTSKPSTPESGSHSSSPESHSSSSESHSSSSESHSSSSESHSSSSESNSSSSESHSSSPKSHSSSSESQSFSSKSLSVSSALSYEPPKTSQPVKNPAPISQKTVPIVHNPLLTMLSLSNKNKRKNVKRKSCPDQLSQPSKIVFGSPQSVCNRRSTSPCFEPPSPNLDARPEPQQTDPNQVANLDHQTTVYHVGFYEKGDGSFITTPAYPTHGPPPSVRDPSLVPSNIIISSVNVLNPYWTPGQIGEQQTWVTPGTHGLHPDQVVRKKSNNKRNRKKGLKKHRRRMAARSKMLDQGGIERDDQNDDWGEGSERSESDDEDCEEEEIQQEVEEAYQQFINSGGHSRSTDAMDSSSENVERIIGTKEVNGDSGAFRKTLAENWNSLSKIDNQCAIVGSKIAIRTWEISIESFTPQLVIYYGKVIDSNEAKLSMKLDSGCIPKSGSTKGEWGEGIKNQEIYEEVEENDYNDDDEEEEEETRVDVKQAIRKSHRDAIINHLWGQSSPDIHNWEWNNVLDARAL